MTNPRAKELLLELLSLNPGKDLTYDGFRIKYEYLFNFDLDKNSVSPKEFQAFKRLFDRVIWYSPFPDEREKIPSYIGEKEMNDAIREARRVLGLKKASDELS